MSKFITGRAVGVGLVLVGTLLLASCGSTHANVRLTGVEDRATLSQSLPTHVYVGADRNTANVYLTNLPPELWRTDANLEGITGTLVHIHMFLAAEAGKTPISSDASNATVRYVVVSRGRVGVYAGGGFLLRSGNPGDARFGGRMSRASLKLLKASPGFNDLLGPSEFTCSFMATKDEATSAILGERLRSILDGIEKK